MLYQNNPYLNGNKIKNQFYNVKKKSQMYALFTVLGKLGSGKKLIEKISDLQNS